MDRQRQTIELLQLLGSDVTASVLAQLQPGQADKLRANLMSAPSQILLRPKTQKQLLDSFEEFFEFALKARGPEPSHGRDAIAQQQEHGSPNDTHEESSDESDEPTQPALVLTGDPLVDLQLIGTYQLSQALESEQPRTTAILLNHLGPRLAADVLSLFSAEYQKSVARELSRDQHAPQILVERIARAALNRAMTISPTPPDRRSHAERLAEMLRSVPRNFRMSMLSAIEEQDAELSQTLLKKMYRFEDLASLESRQVQRILGEVDAATLTTALFNSDDDLKAAVLGNLSRRARQTIDEEMQYQTTIPDARVIQAREKIAEIIARVDQETE